MGRKLCFHHPLQPYSRNMGNRWRVGAIAVAISMGVAACSSTPKSPTSSGSSTSNTIRSTAAAECSTNQIRIAVSKGLAGGGDEGAVITFTDISAVTCKLTGYPTVEAIDSAGHEVSARHSLSGYLGGLYTSGPIPIVTLTPGTTASSTIEAIDHPINTGGLCPLYSYLLVGLPRMPATMKVSAVLPDEATSLAACSSPEIHPVVAGSAGNNG